MRTKLVLLGLILTVTTILAVVEANLNDIVDDEFSEEEDAIDMENVADDEARLTHSRTLTKCDHKCRVNADKIKFRSTDKKRLWIAECLKNCVPPKPKRTPKPRITCPEKCRRVHAKKFGKSNELVDSTLWLDACFAKCRATPTPKPTRPPTPTPDCFKECRRIHDTSPYKTFRESRKEDSVGNLADCYKKCKSAKKRPAPKAKTTPKPKSKPSPKAKRVQRSPKAKSASQKKRSRVSDVELADDISSCVKKCNDDAGSANDVTSCRLACISGKCDSGDQDCCKRRCQRAYEGCNVQETLKDINMMEAISSESDDDISDSDNEGEDASDSTDDDDDKKSKCPPKDQKALRTCLQSCNPTKPAVPKDCKRRSKPHWRECSHHLSFKDYETMWQTYPDDIKQISLKATEKRIGQHASALRMSAALNEVGGIWRIPHGKFYYGRMLATIKGIDGVYAYRPSELVKFIRWNLKAAPISWTNKDMSKFDGKYIPPQFKCHRGIIEFKLSGKECGDRTVVALFNGQTCRHACWFKCAVEARLWPICEEGAPDCCMDVEKEVKSG